MNEFWLFLYAYRWTMYIIHCKKKKKKIKKKPTKNLNKGQIIKLMKKQQHY